MIKIIAITGIFYQMKIKKKLFMIQFHITESDFLLSSDSSDAESSDLEETEQTRIGPEQVIIESETNF
jgi:hypothetical protein